MVRVGSTWTSSDFYKFQVVGLEKRDDGVWVSYLKYGQDRTYECLVDAFLQRFREHVN